MDELLTHLAPTADIPPTKSTKANPVCDGPCPACGQRVLTGQSRDGTRVVVDLAPQTTYYVTWHKPDEPPLMSESRGYVVHACRGCL